MNIQKFMNDLNQLKAQGGDPNQMIQQLMNNGKVSQQMYDSAVQKAQQIQQMLTPNARR